jgi:hypothetical protein
MYAKDAALKGIQLALAARGFKWPEKGAKDKDSVVARLMAFDALHNLTGLSRSAISMLVSNSPSNTTNMIQRVERCYRTPIDRANWIVQARASIDAVLSQQEVA